MFGLTWVTLKELYNTPKQKFSFDLIKRKKVIVERKNNYGKVNKRKELSVQRFGKEGTKEREQFREKTFSFYFGETIKNRRKELHRSQENLAERIDKKRPYISRIENGEDIRLSSFSLLANALGLTIQLTAA